MRADVFLFAIQTQQDPAEYDVLDLSHWQFWVVAADAIRTKAGKSVGIGWVRDHGTGPYTHHELPIAIEAHRA